MKKIWDKVMEWLPMIWGLLFVGIITSGMIALIACCIRLIFEAIGVV